MAARDNPYHWPFDDPRFPVILSPTASTEMYGAGAMSRWLPWLAELQPAAFVEISPELAAELGVVNGDWVTRRDGPAEIEARALVTRRMRAARHRGRVGSTTWARLPLGRKGLVTGDPPTS